MSDGNTSGPVAGVSRRGALGQLAWGVAAVSAAAMPGEAAAAQDATPAAAAVPPDFKVVLHAAQEQT